MGDQKIVNPQTKTRLSLFNVLLFLCCFYTIFFAVLWIYGAATVNTGGPLDNVTFSYMLATNETMRLFYMMWLVAYAIGVLVNGFLIAHDPLAKKNVFMLTHHVLCLDYFRILGTLARVYYVLTVLKILGLYGVLYFPVTDPDQTIETLHYVSAAMAFGCAVAISALLLTRRFVMFSAIKKSWHSTIMYFNIFYVAVELGLAIWFSVECFQPNYATTSGLGYIEFFLSLFCVVDGFWQLNEAAYEDVDLIITNLEENAEQSGSISLDGEVYYDLVAKFAERPTTEPIRHPLIAEDPLKQATSSGN